jgi:hypothetical protein
MKTTHTLEINLVYWKSPKLNVSLIQKCPHKRSRIMYYEIFGQLTQKSWSIKLIITDSDHTKRYNLVSVCHKTSHICLLLYSSETHHFSLSCWIALYPQKQGFYVFLYTMAWQTGTQQFSLSVITWNLLKLSAIEVYTYTVISMMGVAYCIIWWPGRAWKFLPRWYPWW